MSALMLVGVCAGLLSPRLTTRERDALGTDEALHSSYLSGLASAGLDRFRTVLLIVGVANLAIMLFIEVLQIAHGRSVGLEAGLVALLVVGVLDLVLVLVLTGRTEAAQRRRIAMDRAFVAPVADLVVRYRWWLLAILLLVALYRLPDFLTGVMANPLYITLGFQKAEIATVTKVWGIWIGIGGAFAGGLAIARIGLMPTLLIGGIAASASHLCLALLAAQGQRLALLALSVGVESFAGSFAGTALIAYMSSLVSPQMAASQYALLSSLYALPGKIIGGLSGFAVARWGFATFFASTSTIGIPVAILCLAVWAHQRQSGRGSVAISDTQLAGGG